MLNSSRRKPTSCKRRRTHRRCQRAEHYEMTGYGRARTYAEMIGDNEGAKLLQTTLYEEEQTDLQLTHLAKSSINLVAAHFG
ncbi:MAG: DUF892 family protein [Chthoniobacterales bacterium]